MQKNDIAYKENEWVRDFFRGKARSIAAVAAKGTGKTFIASLWAMREACKKQPGQQGLITLNTLQQTRDIWNQNVKPILETLHIPYEYNKSEMNLSFDNGSLVHLRSAEQNVVKRVESIEYSWWWGDECQDYDPSALKTFNSRVRKGLKRKRITAMPADPDAFLYEFIENMECKLYELSLYDNPDKEFVEEYEKILRQVYSGEELKRYLQGERVSLSGLGLFAANQEHRDTVEYDPTQDLYLVWDFNVEYRAVTAYQQVGVVDNRPMYNCIESFQLKNYTTKEDAEQMCRKFSGHKARIFLHGDASGDNRSAQTSDSMWNQIKKVFKAKFPSQTRYVVPRSNPNVKDTIQVTNWALRNNLLYFSDKAKIAYRYLVAAKADKYGEIDKSNDYQEGGAKSHEVDTIRYFAWLAFEKYFPGREQRKVGVTKLKGY